MKQFMKISFARDKVLRRKDREKRRRLLLLLTAIFAVVIIAACNFRNKEPHFTSSSPYVSDNANVFDDSVSTAVTRLNNLWKQEADGAQLFIVTINSLPDNETIEDYSMALAEKTKPGQKEKDNGLLYLIVKDTHQDRLEVGYGLESTVTDSEASQILDSAHASYKRNDYSAGVKSVINSLNSILVADDMKAANNGVENNEAKGNDEGEQDSLARNVNVAQMTDWVLSFLFIAIIGWQTYRSFRYGLRYGKDDGDNQSSGSSRSFHSSSHGSSGNGGHFGGGGASGSW